MDTVNRMTCDHYTREQWDDAAAQMAALLQEHVFDRHFGACPWFVERYFVFFGNEGPSNVAAMLASVRQEIEMAPGMEEVGAGTDVEGYSWALIVRVDDAPNTGTDNVCAIMRHRINRAWRIARGILSEKPGNG